MGLPSCARCAGGELARAAEDVELDLVLDVQASRLAQGVPGLVTGGTAGGRGGAGVGQGRKPAAGRL
ncbi:hypothetical protein OG883_40615 [Streptomyces sp. NBC_01142]|uniref:hypothetical protein n=1 Tax=Streptomyces sp. NBC_01142 TaxID=2975865 RepID=UPI00225509CE|nr:hypothetical protein [Streptomyces sp. NBC_01142]MCX4825984.1 hypothetical protein [Streptomyces sp. NBC_01142]